MTDDLRRRIERAAKALKDRGAKEVFLFGSAATDTMRDNSDLDFAVSGLPPEVFFRAGAEAEDAADITLDLVDLDIDNPFTRYLKEEGELKRVG